MAVLLTSPARSYRFDVRQSHRMMAAGIFEDHKVELVGGRFTVRLNGPDTIVEVRTGLSVRGIAARYTDVVRYSARADESVPIELDGNELGHVAVADLIARQK